MRIFAYLKVFALLSLWVSSQAQEGSSKPGAPEGGAAGIESGAVSLTKSSVQPPGKGRAADAISPSRSKSQSSRSPHLAENGALMKRFGVKNGPSPVIPPMAEKIQRKLNGEKMAANTSSEEVISTDNLPDPVPLEDETKPAGPMAEPGRKNGQLPIPPPFEGDEHRKNVPESGRPPGEGNVVRRSDSPPSETAGDAELSGKEPVAIAEPKTGIKPFAFLFQAFRNGDSFAGSSEEERRGRFRKSKQRKTPLPSQRKEEPAVPVK